MTRPSDNQRAIPPLLVLLFGTVCISFAAVFVKLLGMDLMGPTAIGFWRAFLGSLILFVWSSLSGQSLRMPRPILAWSVLAGFIFFLDLFFWHRSIVYCGAGMATILASTQVFVVAVLGYVVFKERLSIRFFAAALSAILGVTLLIGIGSGIDFGGDYLPGIVFGLLTGVVYGSYLVIMKVIGHRENRPDFRTVMAWTSMFTACFLMIAAFVEGDRLTPPSLYALAILGALGLVVQTLGWWAITDSLPRLVASRSSLILVLQPVLATVWGVLFFAEYLTAVQIGGAVVTLAAIYVGSVRQRD